MWRLTKDLLRINSTVVSQDMEDVICAWIILLYELLQLKQKTHFSRAASYAMPVHGEMHAQT